MRISPKTDNQESDGEPATGQLPSHLVTDPNPACRGPLPARADAIPAPPAAAVEVPTVTMAAMTVTAMTVTAMSTTMTTVMPATMSMTAAMSTMMSATMVSAAVMTTTVTAMTTFSHRVRGERQRRRHCGHQSKFT